VPQESSFVFSVQPECWIDEDLSGFPHLDLPHEEAPMSSSCLDFLRAYAWVLAREAKKRQLVRFTLEGPCCERPRGFPLPAAIARRTDLPRRNPTLPQRPPPLQSARSALRTDGFPCFLFTAFPVTAKRPKARLFGHPWSNRFPFWPKQPFSHGIGLLPLA